MFEMLIRLGLLSLLGIVAGLLTLLGKLFVNNQRQQALKAPPPAALPESATGETAQSTAVRILSFSSPDCHQCKRFQAPALERVLEARGEGVTVTKVDATTEHDLVQTYRVLTVPSTVILDTAGRAHAINYGFANTDRLLTQVDEILAKVPSLQ
jgi:thiol-disulfide isomerase/thioredoxin